MTDTLEDRVKLLEKEIQEKNRLIATLQKTSLASFLFGSYMHKMNNRIAHLSFLLSSHFEICRKKGADKYINDITGAFEDLRNIYETMRDTLLEWKPENKVSIEQCIQAAIKIVDKHLRESKIILKTELDTNSGNIRVPKREFTNVLLSVLINAIDALQEINTRERLILIQTIFQGKSTSITITDNGHGIDNNVITKIWEPGFTTKRGKNGLGLTWSKIFVVELLGGHITVESELGKFTKINIILPEEQEQEYENTPLD